MIIAVAAGRRIYSNLKKAIRYIVSIHIPIILAVSLPLFLGWIYPDIFTPVHVIFLELWDLCVRLSMKMNLLKTACKITKTIGSTFLSLKKNE
jgi:Ca2+-transporting ATPase